MAPRVKTLLAVDTETTGVDLYHGAKPFFVTTCDPAGNQLCWEWDVDPETRNPVILPGDVAEIRAAVAAADEVVLHNPKFDAAALAAVGFGEWPWEKTHDTLIASHLLASNKPHDLTALAVQYLGRDPSPYEAALEAATKDARRLARSKFPAWRIAKKGLPEMPSATETVWRADYWLPRAVAAALGYPPDHPWNSVLEVYGNSDTAVTVCLWPVIRAELERRDLWDLYLTRMKLLPVAHRMERRGVTVDRVRLEERRRDYGADGARAAARCVKIARAAGYDLTLPKSGNNKSLTEFCFTTLGLPVLGRTDAGAPSLDKEVIDKYLVTLPDRSKGLEFIKSLAAKRSRDTALNYMAGYERFWVPLNPESENDNGWRVLHPSMNPTGTGTLRWSMKNPNPQNISRKEDFNLRYMFGPAPGQEWWSLDAKNIELRLPAYESGEADFIALFERPDDPPYYGSNHLLISHILHPEMFEACRDDRGNVDGRLFKKKYESTWYKWVKNGNFACVPMDTEALTRTGWKKYQDVAVGDEVLGYDRGTLKWTKILDKFRYESAPLIKMANDFFEVTSTPNHRWLGTKRTGSVRNRRWEDQYVTTAEINGEYRVKTSAPVDDECRLTLSPDEAAIIAFVYGDGSIETSEYVGGNSQAGGRKIKFRVRVWQSKPVGVKYLDDLFARWGKKVRRVTRPTGIIGWELDPNDARDLWTRAGLWESRFDPDLEQFVIDLGSVARESFLEAAWVAEGSTDKRGHRTYAQNAGRFANAIRLAVFMKGKYPTTHHRKDNYGSGKDPTVIREGKPLFTGQRLIKKYIGTGPVWCIRTGLGTWVMRQGERIMLTGNSLYGAVDKADGTGTADRAYHVPGAQSRIKARLKKMEALNQHWIRFANKHGYVETIPDRTVNPRRGYPLMCTRTDRGRVLETVPLNYHIQGTAMWWMGKAMIRCSDALAAWNRADPRADYAITLQVHDELVFDFPRRADPRVNPKGSNLGRVAELKRLMEEGGRDIGIPTPVSVEYNPAAWSEGFTVSV